MVILVNLFTLQNTGNTQIIAVCVPEHLFRYRYNSGANTVGAYNAK